MFHRSLGKLNWLIKPNRADSEAFHLKETDQGTLLQNSTRENCLTHGKSDTKSALLIVLYTNIEHSSKNWANSQSSRGLNLVGFFKRETSFGVEL